MLCGLVPLVSAVLVAVISLTSIAAPGPYRGVQQNTDGNNLGTQQSPLRTGLREHQCDQPKEVPGRIRNAMRHCCQLQQPGGDGCSESKE